MPANDPTEVTVLTSTLPAEPPAVPPATMALTGKDTGEAVIGLRGDFGDYELLNEIGRGGMGVVYRARQKKLNRFVALKLILGGRLASQDDLDRFLVEAKAAAHLDHTNIVTVYEIGNVDGQHYFSMEFIEGETLARRLHQGPLPGRKAARILLTVAEALDYAHRHNVLHRDLKPSNILIDADDQPFISDFGLAKRLDADATRKTQTGAILGTPSYMSPEQAAGRVHEMGPTSDIYGMGALLYEMLTGRPPFRSDTPLDTIMHVLHSEPVPPRLLNPKVEHDLETICLKCLEKDPRKRYASAEDVAKELHRYLNGESISARSFNVFDRISRILDRSQHDVAFHTWGTMLFLVAGVVFLEHVAVFLLAWTRQPEYLFLLARASQLVFLGLIFWANHGHQMLPRTPAERELWTIWIGYLLAYASAYLVVQCLCANGVITTGDLGPVNGTNLIVYPLSAVLSGLAFFVMGSNYWGRCYAIGIAFMALAVVCTLHPTWAPLEFGVLWAVALSWLGLRLRRLAARASEERQNFYTQPTLPLPEAPAAEENCSAGTG